MGIAALNCLGQLIHDVLGGRLVGIPHSKVDNILAAGTGCRLQLANNIENIRRQSFYPLKVVVHVLAPSRRRGGPPQGLA